MRKYKRYALRKLAERTGQKPSKYVALAWDRYQTRLRGRKTRLLNQKRGTKKRRGRAA